MNLLCKLGIHFFDIIYLKNNTKELYYQTRTCRFCKIVEVNEAGIDGDDKWHNLETYDLNNSSEKDDFNNSVVCKNPIV